MNILFLDFDGVLNSKQHILMMKNIEIPGKDSVPEADLEYMKAAVNPNNMWALKYILENVPDLQIVISSSWRLHFCTTLFKELFKLHGIDENRLLDKTPTKLSSQRVHEIRMWLGEHPNTSKWIALDDHPIFFLGDPDKAHEILTNQWTGLTLEDAFKIISYFKPDFEVPVIRM